MNMKTGICLLVGLFIVGSDCLAETIYLNNGSKIQGRIIERNNEKVVVDFHGVAVTYYPSDIARIEGAAAAAAAPGLTARPESSSAALPSGSLPSFENRPAAPRDVSPDSSADASLAAKSKGDLIYLLMDISGTRQQMNQMLNQIVAQSDPAQAQQLRQALSIDEILAQLVPVYDKYFTQEELSGLIKFYQSPLGRKLLQVTPLIMQESLNASMNYLQSKFGGPPPQQNENPKQ